MHNLDTILLVEDDKITRAILRECLEDHDFVVLEAANGHRAVEILLSHPVNLVLLDLHLPDGKGTDFIRNIKAKTNVPILVVSGDGDEKQKILSFELGADDYVTKPFQAEVLMARVKAHIRRYTEILGGEVPAQNTPSNLCFDGWTMDRMKYQIFDRNGCSADLSHSEFKALEFLIVNADRVVKREELCALLSHGGYKITPRAIDVKITRIRKKITCDDAQQDVIRTVYGVGYIFNRNL